MPHPHLLRLVELALARVVGRPDPRGVGGEEGVDGGVVHGRRVPELRRVDRHVGDLHLLHPVAQEVARLGVGDGDRRVEEPRGAAREEVVAEGRLEAGDAPVLALGVGGPGLAVDLALGRGSLPGPSGGTPRISASPTRRPIRSPSRARIAPSTSAVAAIWSRYWPAALASKASPRRAPVLVDLALLDAVDVPPVELALPDAHGHGAPAPPKPRPPPTARKNAKVAASTTIRTESTQRWLRRRPSSIGHLPGAARGARRRTGRACEGTKAPRSGQPTARAELAPPGAR